MTLDLLRKTTAGIRLTVLVCSVVAAVALVGAIATAQNPAPARPAVQDNPELTRIYEADQAERANARKPGPDTALRDGDRLKRVAALLDAGEVRTGDDFFHAAQVFNHGVTPDDYLRSHVLAVLAASKGTSAAMFLSAAALDRYLRSIGRPQVFGTQLTRQDGKATNEPFDRSMSDGLRTAFGVPSLSEQESRLREMNKLADK